MAFFPPFRRHKFIYCLIFAATGYYFFSGEPRIDDIRTMNGERVTVSGVLPPNIGLSVGGKYSSPKCTTSRLLITPGGGAFDPTWRSERAYSYSEKFVSAKNESQSYKFVLGASDIGRCQWKLDSLRVDFTVSPGSTLPNDSIRYVFQYDESVENATEIKMTPVIYPANVTNIREEGIEKRIEWVIDKAFSHGQGFNFKNGNNVNIAISPVNIDGYSVDITRRFKTTANFPKNPAEIAVTYPDGTTYRYENRQSRIYGMKSPESRLVTLEKSNMPEEVFQMAEIYADGKAVKKDIKKAARLYFIAAQSGVIDQTSYYWMLREKFSGLTDEEKQQYLSISKRLRSVR